MSRHTRGWIRRVAVGIPARDEAARVVACLRSVQRAVDSLSPDIDVAIVLAGDDCVDGTDLLAGALAGTDPRLRTINGVWRSAGAARAAAVEHALGCLDDVAGTGTTWIATTDADSVVGEDWLRRQLHHADHGADAVAGVVDLLDEGDRTPAVAAAFQRVYVLGEQTHGHVHGANMGVRANAYRAAGGFPQVALSEDHALWNALGSGGFRRVSPVDVRVSTSARLRGRAIGGFADTMAGAVLA